MQRPRIFRPDVEQLETRATTTATLALALGGGLTFAGDAAANVEVTQSPADDTAAVAMVGDPVAASRGLETLSISDSSLISWVEELPPYYPN